MVSVLKDVKGCVVIGKHVLTYQEVEKCINGGSFIVATIGAKMEMTLFDEYLLNGKVFGHETWIYIS